MQLFSHITLPCGFAKVVGKLGTRLQTSQLCCEVQNVIRNLKRELTTSF